jgi:hypothetical protein
MFSKMHSIRRWTTVLALAFAISCGSSSGVAKAQGRVDVFRFPDDWTHIDSKGNEVVMDPIIYKVWKLPGAGNDELLFGAANRGLEGETIGYGGTKLKQEWLGPVAEATDRKYSSNFFAVSFAGDRARARKVTEEERQRAEPILNGYRYIRADQQGIDVFNEKNWPSSLRYEGKLFAKSGRAWGDTVGIVSPAGKWLAVLSYTSPGKRTPSRSVLEEGGEPESGIVHIDIYNAATGEKVVATKQSYKSEPSSIFFESVWVKDQYFVMPLDFNSRRCLLITLPTE